MQQVKALAARWCASVAIALLLGALLAPAASAHAHITGSTPADGAVLGAEPATVSATYGEETSLTQSRFEVYFTPAATNSQVRADTGGSPVDVNQRTQMSATLKPGLGAGTYTVKWHTVTEDDNGIVDGTVSFTVKGSPAGAPNGGTSGSPSSTGTTGASGNASSAGTASGTGSTNTAGSTSTASGSGSMSATNTTNGAGSTLPTTGNPGNAGLLLALLSVLVLSGGLALRRLALR